MANVHLFCNVWRRKVDDDTLLCFGTFQMFSWWRSGTKFEQGHHLRKAEDASSIMASGNLFSWSGISGQTFFGHDRFIIFEMRQINIMSHASDKTSENCWSDEVRLLLLLLESERTTPYQSTFIYSQCSYSQLELRQAGFKRTKPFLTKLDQYLLMSNQWRVIQVLLGLLTDIKLSN